MSIAQANMANVSTDSAAPVPLVARRAKARPAVPDAVVGISLAALLPAAFWTGTIAAVSHALGMTLSGATLAMIAGGIAMFLAIVCSAVMANN